MENYQSHPEVASATGLFEEIENSIEQAGSGKRFANYLIDLVSFYAILFVLGLLAGFTGIGLSFISSLAENSFLDRLFSLLMYGIYMGTVEALSGGLSLGKIITGTRAVNEDGSRISAGTGFLRGLYHAVPFDAFSALGTPAYPWHDRWTNTYVINVRK